MLDLVKSPFSIPVLLAAGTTAAWSGAPQFHESPPPEGLTYAGPVRPAQFEEPIVVTGPTTTEEGGAGGLKNKTWSRQVELTRQGPQFDETWLGYDLLLRTEPDGSVAILEDAGYGGDEVIYRTWAAVDPSGNVSVPGGFALDAENRKAHLLRMLVEKASSATVPGKVRTAFWQLASRVDQPVVLKALATELTRLEVPEAAEPLARIFAGEFPECDGYSCNEWLVPLLERGRSEESPIAAEFLQATARTFAEQYARRAKTILGDDPDPRGRAEAALYLEMKQELERHF